MGETITISTKRFSDLGLEELYGILRVRSEVFVTGQKCLYVDPDVGPRAGWPPHKDIEESRRVIRDIFTNDRTWAVTLRETDEAIGCMGYYIHGESNIAIGENDAEIGYWIAKPYWNRGLATEALRAMVDYCFNVKGFLTLWSDFFIDNPASGRVMEKCGFKDTGQTNWCSHLYHGDDRPVHIMKLEYAL